MLEFFCLKKKRLKFNSIFMQHQEKRGWGDGGRRGGCATQVLKQNENPQWVSYSPHVGTLPHGLLLKKHTRLID